MKLNETIQYIDSKLEDLLALINVNKDAAMPRQDTHEYMRGLYNGIELVRSNLTGQEPILLDTDGVKDSQVMKKYPERCI